MKNNDNSLPDIVLKDIKKALKKYPEGKNQAAVKAALMSAQDYYGWLSPDVLEKIAVELGLTSIQVYEVATFYTLFHTKPVGKNVLSICTNVSCSLRGAQELYNNLCVQLQVSSDNQTTADGQWTLREVECLAACSQAPAAQINGRYCGPLTEEALDELIPNRRVM